jgi:hypothetical protein
MALPDPRVPYDAGPFTGSPTHTKVSAIPWSNCSDLTRLV